MRRLSALFLVLMLLTVTTVRSEDDGFRRIFNGKDLTGWDGNPDLWSVENGVIVGKTTDPKQLTYNQFLVWRGGKLKNFELKATIKVVGNNSGIQYRSKELPEVGKWSVGGYQCDVHPDAPNNAMVYGERTAGIMAQNGQNVLIDPQGERWLLEKRDPVKVNVGDWNEYNVTAKGNHVVHKINGKLATEMTDYGEKTQALEGILAFQVHGGPAMTVQIKDVLLKELPEGGVTKFEKSAIPSSATKFEKAPAKKAAPKADPQSKTDPKTETPKKEQPKARTPTGTVMGENKATPVERITVAKDFKVELLYSVPAKDQGSWVNLCTDDKGRIYVSDQFGGLYRFPAPAPGQPLDPSKIEKVPANVRAANGLLFAFGALYVAVNDYERKMTSGLYRVTDSDGDDQLDKVELLRAMEASGDHGVHAIVPTPDGKALYLITGNSTKPTQFSPASQVPPVFGEDHLLPRMPDGRGFMRDVMGPGGIIYRVSPDGKEFQAYASGFRNVFDAAVNRDGELFTYDADMEYDFNTSWYRPTRINHVTSGAEFGWRNGAGKRPAFYPDNLGSVVDIGPGSPTGMTFGYGAKFPAKYQKALYALDWSWGKLYAIHLEPSSSSYVGTKEEFLTGAPLPITDAIIHPKDGAMYFTIGGRRVQSGLYRVTYTGKESTAPVEAKATTSPERELRHKLESFHGRKDPQAIRDAWPHLDSKDRAIRWAARTAIEHQPADTWADKALTEPEFGKRVEALMALARVKGVCPQHRKPDTPPVDESMRGKLLASLLQVDWSKLNFEQQLTYVRAIEITLNRFGRPDAATVEKLIAKLDPHFPAPTKEMNWLLCETLVYLQSPTAAAKGIALLQAAPSQEEQIEYARSLRFLKTGWTPETRTAYFEWFLKAANYRGGASFEKFIEFIRTDAVAPLSEDEKKSMAEILARKPEKKSVLENLGASLKGRKETKWTMEDLADATKGELKDRNFDTGRKMFSATGCYACHRFDNSGGMTGPDLTAAGKRYSAHDLLDQIVNPSKVINEQFSAVRVVTDDGKVFTGVVVNLNGDSVMLNTDLTEPNLQVSIDRKRIEEMMPSKISPMPENLLAPLAKDEILDLLAYVISGGDRNHRAFKK